MRTDDERPGGGTFMAERFTAFQRALPAICGGLRKDPERLTFGDYTRLVVGWLEEHADVATAPRRRTAKRA